MKKVLLVCLAAAMIFSLAACGSADDVSTDDVTIAEEDSGLIDVTLDVSYVRMDDDIVFNISTNLPDKTQIMLTLTNDSGSTAQGSVTIRNGKAVSSKFSDHGDPLRGDYELRVSTPISRTMDESVQEIIGAYGENLTGQYVTKAFGDNDYIIEACFNFTF